MLIRYPQQRNGQWLKMQYADAIKVREKNMQMQKVWEKRS